MADRPRCGHRFESHFLQFAVAAVCARDPEHPPDYHLGKVVAQRGYDINLGGLIVAVPVEDTSST